MGTAVWGPAQLVPVEGKAGKDVACKNGAQDGLEPGCKRTRMQMVAGEWIQENQIHRMGWTSGKAPDRRL